jgi:hypothetical protein
LLGDRDMRPSILAVAFLLGLVTAAHADPLSHLSGRVLDAKHGTPVESALVLVAGPTGVEHQLSTDAQGRYQANVKPSSYILIFVYGTARSSGRVLVEAGKRAYLEGKVDATEGEVIVIRDRIRPPVPPRATNHKPYKAPPYSDRAVVEDAWTKAWLLLDISSTGQVTRIKWLKRPGYDLEKIAIAEVKKLTFEPARDSSGKAVRTWFIWSIEWPSAWWLDKFIGTRTGMPRVTGLGRRQDAYIPCKGSGPWHMGSLHKTYKDCSQPDLKVAAREPWFVP